MAYLGRQGVTAPLTSADIPDNSITTAKIVDSNITTAKILDDNVTAAKIPAGAVSSDVLYLENNTSTQDLSGTYSTERLYFNDSYQLTGDVTVTGHLALGSVADSDVVITQDSTERTITGSGTIDGGNVLQDTHRTSLTDMTGELGSAVTGSPAITGFGTVTSGTLGSGVTFPEGHVIKVTHSKDSGIRTHGSNSWSKAGNTLDCVVTPNSTSSIFLIGCCIGLYCTGDFSCTFFRDSTNLGDSNDGISRLVNKNNFGGGVIDSPNTTSPITYSFQIRAIDSATTSIGYDDAESFMHVMEIQG